MNKTLRVSLLLFFSSFLIVKAQVPEVQQLPDGVSVNFRNNGSVISQLVKLQVVAEKIIRVTAIPDGAAEGHQSLMVIDTPKRSVEWNLIKEANQVIVKTPYLKASLSLVNGQVSFAGTNGNVILKETPRSALSFVPSSYSGDRFYQITQTFESAAATEGFYGLGQHQNGVMNYKGHQVDLSQYNTDVAVPFLVSSNNYGILWDNYSITKVIDVNELRPLSALKLYSADDQPGWLTASYQHMSGQPFSVQRAESDIDYAYLKDQIKVPEGFKMLNGKVRWEGAVESPNTGTHHLLFKYAGYLKIWINGELKADRWRQPWNAGTIELAQDFVQGKKYKIAIEWIPDGGESYFSVNWQAPIPAGRENQLAFRSEAGDAIDYYFVAGKDIDEVIGGYRQLTGKAPIVPKWALGFWQSRERYKTQEEILSTVQEFRKRKIPLDNIVLDWSYWEKDQWGSQEFDKSRFPDAEGMISQLHDQYHTRFMISVWPKFYKGIDTFNDFEKRGWLYMRNIADGRKDWIGEGFSSTFYDPFNTEARKGFWHLLNTKLYQKGIDAWWLDATEPDIHSNLDLATRKTLFSPAVGSGVRYFNAFPLMNAKGIYEGQRIENPNDRVFILTRSSYAGQQRYAAVTWSGDISSRWHDMKDQISAGINFSLSGLPYWTMDIGGFSVEKRYEKASGADLDEWRALNTRWYQFGAFTPIFRVHGQFPYREVYNIAPESHPAYKSMLYYNKLRYRLMPYIYSLAGKAYHENYTIMRGLVMDYASDKKVLNIDDQFMFGPSLLINPVTEYKALSRSLYLPEGGWYDLYSGKHLAGGRTIKADAPYERMPLYVKEGSIIPVGPELQYTAEKPADEITLYVYAGRDAGFTLYEDESTNNNYEKGKYTLIPFKYDERSKTLTIGRRTGSYEGMIQSRVFNVVWINPKKPVPFNPDQKTKQQITYSGEEILLKM